MSAPVAHAARSILKTYMEAPLPAPETPWRRADLCALDLEMTGLDPETDEIISFATLPIEDGRVRPGSGTCRLVRPRRMPEAETIVIHGLRREELADAPMLSEVIDELLGAITGRPLVVHVAAIEERFLGRALVDAGGHLRNPIIDTAALAPALAARRQEPLREPISLTALAEQLALPVHRPHQADGDALTTAQVFLALATHLDAFEPQTVGSLARAPRRRRPLSALRRVVGRLRHL